MSPLESIIMRVEVSAGTDIKDTCYDLCELAAKLGCVVIADFNGVKVFAHPGDNPTELAEAWNEALMSDSRYKFARCK